MTGANQLLIGVGWSLVVLLAAYRIKKRAARDPALRRSSTRSRADATDVVLARSHSVEMAFLMVATLYGLTLPLKRTISLFDAWCWSTIFVAYLVRIARAPAEEPAAHRDRGASSPTRPERARAHRGRSRCSSAPPPSSSLCAEPFAESLVQTGEEFGISTFLLVKWLAPLASEAPELLIAGMFAWRLNTNAGLGALVSSKVNQWTLLVGTLPIVFAISSARARIAARRAAARRAVRHRRAIGVRGGDPREPQHQRARRVLVARTLARAARDEVRRPDGRRARSRPASASAWSTWCWRSSSSGATIAVRPLLEDGFRTPYDELSRADSVSV